MKRLLVAGLLSVAGLLVAASPGSAEGWATGWGCFQCYPHGFGTDPDDKCWQVGHRENGVATFCENEYLFGRHYCNMSGGACYNEDAGGGSGGGSASGGGSCVVPWGEACPAECSSCTRETYPRTV